MKSQYIPSIYIGIVVALHNEYDENLEVLLHFRIHFKKGFSFNMKSYKAKAFSMI